MYRERYVSPVGIDELVRSDIGVPVSMSWMRKNMRQAVPLVTSVAPTVSILVNLSPKLSSMKVMLMMQRILTMQMQLWFTPTDTKAKM